MGSLLWSSKAFREDDIIMCLQQPECAVISDTTALAPYGALKNNIGSISGYGWTARFFQDYVNDKKILRFPEIVVRLLVSVFEKIPKFLLTSSRVDALTGRCVYDSSKVQKKLGFKYSMTLEERFVLFSKQK